jgi:hypothetical protein
LIFIGISNYLLLVILSKLKGNFLCFGCCINILIAIYAMLANEFIPYCQRKNRFRNGKISRCRVIGNGGIERGRAGGNDFDVNA